MKGVRRFRDYLNEQLKDEQFRQAYDEEGLYAQLAVQVAHLRMQKKLSQKQLAHLLRTSQQTISRLEDPRNTSYSLKTLVKLAAALDSELEVRFHPRSAKAA